MHLLLRCRHAASVRASRRGPTSECRSSDSLADSMRAFGTGSRLRLLWAMLGGEQTVEELVELTGLASSSASHQLRLLRHGRLVAVRRVGRHAYYRLHDHHVAELLQAIRHHHEHVEPPEAGVPRIEDPARLAS